jgi:tRNA(Arg) A34 adenosine deaminase TadA
MAMSLPYPEATWALNKIPPTFSNGNLLEILQGLHRIAFENVSHGGGPFSAALYDEKGELVEVNSNRVTQLSDPRAHAEQVVLANGLRKLQARNREQTELTNCTLFSTGEPCVGCRGVIYLYAPSQVIWSLSSSEIEKLSTFSEGPRMKTFWNHSEQARGIKGSKVAVEKALMTAPFEEFQRRVESGESRKYLAKR